MSDLYDTYLYPTTSAAEELERKVASGLYHLETKKVISPNGWVVTVVVAVKNKF